jgi:hypothetical protein
MQVLRAILCAAALLVAVPAQAQGLPYDPKTATCDEIIAHADDNAATKDVAASVYARGKHMGKQCVEVDYVRAFQLWAEIGARYTINSVLDELTQRANSGNAAAAAHIRKLEAAGLIEETPSSRSRN